MILLTNCSNKGQNESSNGHQGYIILMHKGDTDRAISPYTLILEGDSNPKVDPEQVNPRIGKKHDNFPFYQSKDGYQNSLKNSKTSDVKQDISFMDNLQRPLMVILNRVLSFL